MCYSLDENIVGWQNKYLDQELETFIDILKIYLLNSHYTFHFLLFINEIHMLLALEELKTDKGK